MKRIAICIFLGLALTAICGRWANAVQEAAGGVSGNSQQPGPSIYENQVLGARYLKTRSRQPDELTQALDRYKDAESDADREDAAEEIRDELGKQYDQFLADNEKQIEELQARIERLRDQLDRRREAKSKMVDLEFERVINASEGLIWPEGSRRRRARGINVFSQGQNGGPAWAEVERFPAAAPVPAATAPPALPRVRGIGGGSGRNTR